MYIKSNLKKYVPVCRQYLSTYPADVDLLWEVEGVGGPYQKVKVASKLGSMTLQCKYLFLVKSTFYLFHICHRPSLETPNSCGVVSQNVSFYQYILLFVASGITLSAQFHIFT